MCIVLEFVLPLLHQTKQQRPGEPRNIKRIAK